MIIRVCQYCARGLGNKINSSIEMGDVLSHGMCPECEQQPIPELNRMSARMRSLYADLRELQALSAKVQGVTELAREALRDKKIA